MSDEKVTPEEKLLKAIEKPVNASLRQTKEAVALPMPAGTSLSGYLKRFADVEGLKKLLTFRNAFNLLAVIAVLLTIFWIIDFIRDYSAYNNRFKALKERSHRRGGVAISEQTEPEVYEFLQGADKRNIFAVVSSSHSTVSTQNDVDYAQMLSNFKLVGIIWAKNPQAIVEHTKEQKTQLLSVGDKIDNLTVKNIYQEKIILATGDNREWELR